MAYAFNDDNSKLELEDMASQIKQEVISELGSSVLMMPDYENAFDVPAVDGSRGLNIPANGVKHVYATTVDTVIDENGAMKEDGFIVFFIEANDGDVTELKWKGYTLINLVRIGEFQGYTSPGTYNDTHFACTLGPYPVSIGDVIGLEPNNSSGTTQYSKQIHLTIRFIPIKATS